MQEINVEEIMQGIRKEIAEKHYEDVEYKFRDVHLRLNCSDAVYDKEEFIANLDKAKPHAIVNAYKPLYGNPISKIIKKINRKLIAFYVESIVMTRMIIISIRIGLLLSFRIDFRIQMNASMSWKKSLQSVKKL